MVSTSMVVGNTIINRRRGVNTMEFGMIDLDTNFEYLIVYVNKDNNTVNTWTLPDGSFQLNYVKMKQHGIEILGVYKKLSTEQLSDIEDYKGE